MAGTRDSGRNGATRHDLQLRRSQYSTAEWTLSSILAMLKYFPFYGCTTIRRLEGSASEPALTMRNHRRCAALYPPVMLEELTDKRMLLVGWPIGKKSSACRPFHVEITRWLAARNRAACSCGYGT